MYSRSFNDSGIMIPESYRGTAFSDSEQNLPTKEEEKKSVCNDFPKDSAEQASASPMQRLTPVFSKISSFFSKGGLNFSGFGTEEILLIAAAAFLIFSNDHDIECGLMLLLLLFIS